jgi:hypothetical protein
MNKAVLCHYDSVVGYINEDNLFYVSVKIFCEADDFDYCQIMAFCLPNFQQIVIFLH